MRPPESGWLMVPGVPLVAQRARADCGAAALAMVLRFWQPATNDETVRSWIGSVDADKGLAAGRMREIVRGKGLEAFLIEGKFEDLVREVGQQRPIIVGIVRISGRRAYPHYEVVVGVNESQRKVFTADPAEGWREQDYAEFEARWRPSRRLALVVFPDGSGTCQRAHQFAPERRPGGWCQMPPVAWPAMGPVRGVARLNTSVFALLAPWAGLLARPD
jgi:ABC-type bacteriocin/lantibiotic exporter with double-glycine peptidase domain